MGKDSDAPIGGRRMNKKYTKRYCECKKWQEATHNISTAQNLGELLVHYPEDCPYCHKKLKVRLRKVYVDVHVEDELYNSGIATTFLIPLSDIKKLLDKE